MKATPPLQMLVNPQSFRLSSEKVIADGSWTRFGPIVEHWGDNQDKLEASGKVGAFYAAALDDGSGPGLTRTARQYSAAYQNLISLYLLYKNNAGIYAPDGAFGSKSSNEAKTLLSVLGSIYIYYDHSLYIGSFDSFTMNESDGAPFSLDYSFSFTVRAQFLLDTVPDPKFTYGVSNYNLNNPSNGTIQYTPTQYVAPPTPQPLTQQQAQAAVEGLSPVAPGTIDRIIAANRK